MKYRHLFQILAGVPLVSGLLFAGSLNSKPAAGKPGGGQQVVPSAGPKAKKAKKKAADLRRARAAAKVHPAPAPIAPAAAASPRVGAGIPATLGPAWRGGEALADPGLTQGLARVGGHYLGAGAGPRKGPCTPQNTPQSQGSLKLFSIHAGAEPAFLDLDAHGEPAPAAEPAKSALIGSLPFGSIPLPTQPQKYTNDWQQKIVLRLEAGSAAAGSVLMIQRSVDPGLIHLVGATGQGGLGVAPAASLTLHLDAPAVGVVCLVLDEDDQILDRLHLDFMAAEEPAPSGATGLGAGLGGL